MKQKRVVKLPTTVLSRAKTAAAEQPSQKPQPPPLKTTRKPLAREKVIAALKKLHPMD